MEGPGGGLLEDAREAQADVFAVALLITFFCRTSRLSGIAVLVSVFLPISLIVVALALLNLEKAIFEIMGGIQPGTGNDSVSFRRTRRASASGSRTASTWPRNCWTKRKVRNITRRLWTSGQQCVLPGILCAAAARCNENVQPTIDRKSVV